MRSTGNGMVWVAVVAVATGGTLALAQATSPSTPGQVQPAAVSKPSLQRSTKAPATSINPAQQRLRQCVREGQNPDCDGDGQRSNRFGGTDCDDADPRRAPGRTEVADGAGLDEDCNPATFGERDMDRDGFLDAAAFNVDERGRRTQGDDCDDRRATVNPSSPEVCNGVDDNCSGTIDEGVQMTLYRDEDLDGYGSPHAEYQGCPQGLRNGVVSNSLDCDDADPKRNVATGWVDGPRGCEALK